MSLKETVPTWDEKVASLDAFEERVKRYLKGTKRDERYLVANRILGKFDPDRMPYKTVTKAVTETQLEAEDGSGASLLVAALRNELGPRTMQEAVKLFRQMLTLKDLARGSGESMKRWTARFSQFVDKVGAALHAAEPDIDAAAYLHPVLKGIILMSASGLEPSEQAAVLATSGTPGHRAASRRQNSHHFDDLVESFCRQWSDDALITRDQRTKKQRAQVNALMDDVAALTLTGLPAIEDVKEWPIENEEDEVVDEGYGYFEEDEEEPDAEVLDESYFEEQFGSMEDAEAHVAETYATAARTFQEAKEWVNKLRTARGYFPVVGIAAYDELPTATAARGRGTPRGRGAAGRGGGPPPTGRGRGRAPGGRGSSTSSAPSRNPAIPAPAKRRPTGDGGAVRGGPAHGPRQNIDRDACFLCGQKGHMARECPNRGSTGTADQRKRAFGSYALAGFADAETFDEPEVIECDLAFVGAAEDDIDGYVAFNIEEYPGIGILDGGATRTCGGPRAVQGLVDVSTSPLELEYTDIRFTFAGGESSVANTRLWVTPDPKEEPNFEIGIHAVMADETPLLIGLDMLRRYKIVLDYGDDTVYSHVLGRKLESWVLPTGHLAIKLFSDASVAVE